MNKITDSDSMELQHAGGCAVFYALPFVIGLYLTGVVETPLLALGWIAWLLASCAAAGRGFK